MRERAERLVSRNRMVRARTADVANVAMNAHMFGSDYIGKAEGALALKRLQVKRRFPVGAMRLASASPKALLRFGIQKVRGGFKAIATRLKRGRARRRFQRKAEGK